MQKEIKGWLKMLKLSESALSTILGAAVVIVVGILVFNYFSKGKVSQPIKTEVPSQLEFTAQSEEKTSINHLVKPGENLWNLAIQYYQDGFQWTKIAQANNLTDPNIIYPGQQLRIPDGSIAKIEPITSEKYTVKKGDSLWQIALRAYGDPFRWTDIAKANQLVNPNLIHSGNELIIPR